MFDLGEGLACPPVLVERVFVRLAQRRPQEARLLRLETNRTLAEAISLYRSEGYREVPAFNDEAYAHHWFEKRVRRPKAP